MSDDEQPNNSCSMVGFLGIMIQVGLGALSFSVLIVKRYFQSPKRPWKIWTFDASKQMLSQLVAHFINLTISIALTADKKNSDECLWYFVTNIFDNTMGVFICIVLLKLIENSLKKRRKFEYISGNYYRKIDPLSLTNKPSISQKMKQQQSFSYSKSGHSNIPQKSVNQPSLKSDGDSRMQPLNKDKTGIEQKQSEIPNPNQTQFVEDNSWIIQLAIWNGIVFIGKCALFGLQFGLQKQLQEFSIFILGWIEDYPVLQLLFVIVLVPVIMNGLAYWVQDNFLMKKQKEQQQKNLIEENLNQNARNKDDIQIQIQLQKNPQVPAMSEKTRQRKQSDNQNGNRFQFHDDYDAKDEDNPVQKFENLDKFGKFAL